MRIVQTVQKANTKNLSNFLCCPDWEVNARCATPALGTNPFPIVFRTSINLVQNVARYLGPKYGKCKMRLAAG